MRHRSPWALIPLLLFFLVPISVAADGAYLEELQARADARELAGNRTWRSLLHFTERRLLPGEHSATRAPVFFNAENGYRDARAELHATLEAFFRDPASIPDGEQHPQCAFIARYHWLRDQLAFDDTRLPRRTCSRFRDWYDAIDPQAVTLVFADAFLNSPASMFGHTLLRVDAKEQDDDSRLLAYAINHAAATEDRNGFVFAVRGLTGGYPGMFSIMPYYEKVREYSSLEKRDLWEYELNLSQEETDRMLMHVWELRAVPFPYYFLYQNCSYRLLQLLDVARPGMNLSGRFDWWAIPTDTVRVVLKQEGLLDAAVYRPSSRTRLEHALSRLSSDERALVRALALEDASPESLRPTGMSRQRWATVLESAHDHLHFRFTSGDARPGARERMRTLLVARSRTGQTPETPRPPTPHTRPDQGHGTHRVGIGGGEWNDAGYVSLLWRPAYHDLLDPPVGYQSGAHISFLDTRVQYHPEEERLHLDRLKLVDIESLAPRDRFFRSWSWHVGGGFEQRLRPQGGYSLMGGVEGGSGPSWALDRADRWILYTAAHASVWGSGRLEDDVRAGLGPRVDLLYTGQRWRARLRAEAQQYTNDRQRWRLVAEQDLSLGRHLGLRLSVSREADFEQRVDRVDLSLHWYM